MRVIIIVWGGIGDNIVLFPTLQDLKRYHPEAHIDVIVEPRARSAYRICGLVEEFLPIDYNEDITPQQFMQLVKVVQGRRYDVALILRVSWLLYKLMELAGIPIRIGFKAKEEALLTHAYPLENKYLAECFHDLLQGLGINTPCPAACARILEEDDAWATNERDRLGLRKSSYIIMHGGSSKGGKAKGVDKVYPVENWIQVIQGLRDIHPETSVVAIRGPDDEQFIRMLSECCPAVKVTAPEDVGKLAAMIAGSSLMVCTDSGPMHVAAATGTPTIALFGPSDPNIWLPRSAHVSVCMSPTGTMKGIPPEAVLEEIRIERNR
jgi:ADP-heptose:LPS heptosyltransferase